VSDGRLSGLDCIAALTVSDHVAFKHAPVLCVHLGEPHQMYQPSELSDLG